MTAPPPASLRERLPHSIQWLSEVAPVLLLALLLPSCGLLNLGLLKLKFGCLPEGSMVDTVNGPVRVESLNAGDTVTGFGGGQVQIRQIHQYREDPASSRYLTISFANGSQISASPRHRIDGTPAQQLKVGDLCGGQAVTRIEVLRGVARSFDLLTQDPGYRMGGIPVNSMIEEMLSLLVRKGISPGASPRHPHRPQAQGSPVFPAVPQRESLDSPLESATAAAQDQAQSGDAQ